MPTLYVENVPEDLYEALRERARAQRRSISAAVLDLLSENVPTPAELTRRAKALKLARRISARRSPGAGPFAAAEEMQREDRAR
jgi:plasmid stability protein